MGQTEKSGCPTGRSAFPPTSGIVGQLCQVRKVPILLQKSKIKQPQKSRKSRSLAFPAAASLFSATAEVRDRFWMKRYGPSRRRAQNASTALRIFVRHPKKTFATISARRRHRFGHH